MSTPNPNENFFTRRPDNPTAEGFSPREMEREYREEQTRLREKSQRQLDGLSDQQIDDTVEAARILDEFARKQEGVAFQIGTAENPIFIKIHELEPRAREIAQKIQERLADFPDSARAFYLSTIWSEFEGVDAGNDNRGYASMDEIPPAKPIWEYTTAAEGRSDTLAPAVEASAPAAPEIVVPHPDTPSAAELLESRGGFHGMLEQVYSNPEITAGSTVELTRGETLRNPSAINSANFEKRGGKGGVRAPGTTFRVVDAEPQTHRWQRSGREVAYLKVANDDGQEFLVAAESLQTSSEQPSMPAEVARLFGVDGQNSPLGTSLRRGSREQFENTVRESTLSEAEQEELIAAFKVLDITRGADELPRGSGSPERLAILNELVGKLGAEDINNLFETNVGASPEWSELYAEVSEIDSGINKNKIKNLLDGGEVFMLRVDQAEHGGTLEADIDSSPGSAWIASLDTPTEIRGETDYRYKFSALEGEQAAAIVAKYAGENANPDNFEVAMFEVPNCENPAIVLKPLAVETPPPTPAPQPEINPQLNLPPECISLARFFRNEAEGGLFNLPDFRHEASEQNHLLDAKVIDATTGEVLRESENVEAEARTEIRVTRQTAERFESLLPRSQRENPDSWLDGDVGPDDAERPRREWINEMTAELRAILDNPDSAPLAIQAWRTKWETEANSWGVFDRQTAEKMIDLAHFQAVQGFENLEATEKRIDRETIAARIFKFGENWMNTRIGNENYTLENFSASGSGQEVLAALEDWYGKPKLEAIKILFANKTSQEFLEYVLYHDPDGLRIARPPMYVADNLVFPQQREGEIRMHTISHGLEELWNTSNVFQKALQVIGLVTGVAFYAPTGLGISDNLIEQYQESGKVEDLFEDGVNSQEFQDFRNFVEETITKCNQVYNVPVDEIEALLPGWRVFTEIFSSQGHCPGANGSISGEVGNTAPGGGL